MIEILLVDDQPSVRHGWRMRFLLEDDLSIVGEASSAPEAVELAASLKPDVVLMDVKMPDVDGIVGTRQLKAALPDCAVVLVSIHDDAATRQASGEVGAAAFVGKQEPFEALLAAIRQAAGHGGGEA